MDIWQALWREWSVFCHDNGRYAENTLTKAREHMSVLNPRPSDCTLAMLAARQTQAPRLWMDGVLPAGGGTIPRYGDVLVGFANESGQAVEYELTYGGQHAGGGGIAPGELGTAMGDNAFPMVAACYSELQIHCQPESRLRCVWAMLPSAARTHLARGLWQVGPVAVGDHRLPAPCGLPASHE